MNAAKVCTNDTAMSYPLARLPYSLRRRLRELATPLEAYSLQIAGPEYKYFQPTQGCRRVERVSYHRDYDNETQFNSNEGDLGVDENCEIVTETLYITGIATPDQKLLFEKVRLEPEIIDILQCEISTTFLRAVASFLEQPVKELNLQDIVVQSFDEQNIAQIVCNATAFKKLETIAVENSVLPISQWIDAMLEAKFSNVQYFYLSKVSSTSLDIDAETLLKFVKAQANFREFDIFVMKSDFEVVKDQVEQRFGKYFDCKADPDVFKLVLSVKE